jgi:hypothetical protein
MWGKIITFFLMSISFSAFAGLDIKGIEVDKKADCAYIKSLDIRKGTFAESCKNMMPTWYHEISFLDSKAEMTVSQNSSGMITTIAVYKFNFEKALNSLENKFGKSEITKSIIQNRFGAEFEQVEATWRDGNIILSLKKHGGKVDEPVLILYGQEFIKNNKNKNAPSSDI